MKKTRKHYTPDEKVAVLRRHLLTQEPISKLCDELGLHRVVATGANGSPPNLGQLPPGP